MKMHELRELIRLVDESKIEEFELENDGTKVLIKKALSDRQAVAIDSPAEVRPVEPEQGNRVEAAPAPVPATEAISPQQAPAATGEEEADLHKIVSPMVGTFTVPLLPIPILMSRMEAGWTKKRWSASWKR